MAERQEMLSFMISFWSTEIDSVTLLNLAWCGWSTQHQRLLFPWLPSFLARHSRGRPHMMDNWPYLKKKEKQFKSLSVYFRKLNDILKQGWNFFGSQGLHWPRITLRSNVSNFIITAFLGLLLQKCGVYPSLLCIRLLTFL